ncbi:MAG TPA: cupin domain-containing protein, partial [Gallionella sp.]|nr:cupin domain-containing protein [Gallionella sp.]
MSRLISFAQADSSPGYDHPKAERLVAGNPLRTTREHYVNSSGEVSCGVWACEVGSWRIEFDERSDEYFYVLEGRICITGADGKACEFGPGDAC